VAVPRYDFAGRVALVTGGAGGIGRALAARLAEGGAKLVLWDLDRAMFGPVGGAKVFMRERVQRRARALDVRFIGAPHHGLRGRGEKIYVAGVGWREWPGRDSLTGLWRRGS